MIFLGLTFNIIRFNETEGVAALTSIISRYKIEIQDEPQFKHETFEECKSRILATDFAFLLSYVVLKYLLLILSASVFP